MNSTGLGLEKASRTQGFTPIPSGTVVELVQRIKPGGIGAGGLYKRSAKGDCVGINTECTVRGGAFNGRKLQSFRVIEGSTVGQQKAVEHTMAYLRAIFEAVRGIDPNDEAPETYALRASAQIGDFNGVAFLAELGIERGAKKADGFSWPDKNIITKVLRIGDAGYRQVEQPPASPSSPTTAPSPTTTTTDETNGTPSTVASRVINGIATPKWAN